MKRRDLEVVTREVFLGEEVALLQLSNLTAASSIIRLRHPSFLAQHTADTSSGHWHHVSNPQRKRRETRACVSTGHSLRFGGGSTSSISPHRCQPLVSTSYVSWFGTAYRRASDPSGLARAKPLDSSIRRTMSSGSTERSVSTGDAENLQWRKGGATCSLHVAGAAPRVNRHVARGRSDLAAGNRM